MNIHSFFDFPEIYFSLYVSTASGSHFTKRGHIVSHLKGLVLEKVKSSDPLILKRKEHLLIKKKLTPTDMG